MSIIRTALVTGPANDIGRAIALRLAQDGFQVAINDLTSQEARLRELQHEIELKGLSPVFKTDLAEDDVNRRQKMRHPSCRCQQRRRGCRHDAKSVKMLGRLDVGDL